MKKHPSISYPFFFFHAAWCIGRIVTRYLRYLILLASYVLSFFFLVGSLYSLRMHFSYFVNDYDFISIYHLCARKIPPNPQANDSYWQMHSPGNAAASTDAPSTASRGSLLLITFTMQFRCNLIMFFINLPPSASHCRVSGQRKRCISQFCGDKTGEREAVGSE